MSRAANKDTMPHRIFAALTSNPMFYPGLTLLLTLTGGSVGEAATNATNGGGFVGYIISAVVSIMGVGVVWYFKDRIAARQTSVQHHKTETEAATRSQEIRIQDRRDLVELSQEALAQVVSATERLLEQQRAGFTARIDSMLAEHKQAVEAIRDEKHHSDGRAEIWRARYIRMSERVEVAGCDMTKIYYGDLKPLRIEDFINEHRTLKRRATDTDQPQPDAPNS